MKIKIPKVKPTAKQADEWSRASGYFREYLNECDQAGIEYDMVLQATADALAYLLVRHSRNTQAIMSLMNLTIAKQAQTLRESELKNVRKQLGRKEK